MTLQITENQSGYLAVEHRDENNKLFAFFGVIAVIVGLVFGGWALHRATYSEQLTCEGQDAARCTVRRESLLRTSDSSVPVRQIASAQFDEETDPPRLRLLTENDNLELRLAGAEEGCTGCGPRTTKYGPAQQVEMFLDDSGTDRLVIRSDYRPGWSSLLVLAVVFFAVGGVLLWQIVTSHIELTPQWLVVGRNRLVGGSRSEYRTEAIQSVEVERSEVTDRGHNQKRYVYRVVVEMENGESVPLTARWCSAKKDVEQIRDEIARTAKLKDGN
jgi:hypothetical protein